MPKRFRDALVWRVGMRMQCSRLEAEFLLHSSEVTYSRLKPGACSEAERPAAYGCQRRSRWRGAVVGVRTVRQPCPPDARFSECPAGGKLSSYGWDRSGMVTGPRSSVKPELSVV